MELRHGAGMHASSKDFNASHLRQAGSQLSKFLVKSTKCHRDTAIRLVSELMEREIEQHMGHVCSTASDLAGASLQILLQGRQGQEHRGRDISLAVYKRPFFSLLSHSISHPLPGRIWQNQCCTNQVWRYHFRGVKHWRNSSSLHLDFLDMLWFLWAIHSFIYLLLLLKAHIFLLALEWSMASNVRLCKCVLRYCWFESRFIFTWCCPDLSHRSGGFRFAFQCRSTWVKICLCYKIWKKKWLTNSNVYEVSYIFFSLLHLFLYHLWFGI